MIADVTNMIAVAIILVGLYWLATDRATYQR